MFVRYGLFENRWICTFGEYQNLVFFADCFYDDWHSSATWKRNYVHKLVNYFLASDTQLNVIFCPFDKLVTQWIPGKLNKTDFIGGRPLVLICWGIFDNIVANDDWQPEVVKSRVISEFLNSILKFIFGVDFILYAAWLEYHFVSSQSSSFVSEDIIYNSQLFHDWHVTDMDTVTKFVFELFIKAQEPCQKGFNELEEDVEWDWN